MQPVWRSAATGSIRYPRREDHPRNLSGRAGVRGTFNDDWNYEVSANYGEHREKNKIISNVNIQRYLLGIDSVRNAAGQIVCRSQVNPAAAIAYVQNADGSAADPARLAADIAACVPINPFGQGTLSQAARDYVTVNSRASGKITQFVANGFVAGDLSQLFELPGGPVGFSVGGEYRRETLKYELDDLTQQGYAFYNAIPSFGAPSFAVKEVYGELRVPLLKDVPFFKELTLSGSGRISDYKGATGTVYSYGGQVEYRPINDIPAAWHLSEGDPRAQPNRAVSAQGQNFAPARTILAQPATSAQVPRHAPPIARRRGGQATMISSMPVAFDPVRRQPEPDGGNLRQLYRRYGHHAVLRSGPVAVGRLLQDHREQGDLFD